MKCKNCGADIENNSKFCGYCGESVENKVSIEELVKNVMTSKDENNKVDASITTVEKEEAIKQDIEVEQTQNLSSSQELSQEQKVQNIIDIIKPPETSKNDKIDVVLENNSNSIEQKLEVENKIGNDISPILNIENTQSIPVKNELNKKNNNKLGIILGGIALAFIVIVIVVSLIIFNPNRKSSDIEVLKNAINNLSTKGKESGTIDASIIVESKTNDTINFLLTTKYAKVNDNYDLSITLNKTLLFDEINLYSRVNENKLNLYIQSKVVDMMEITSSNDNIWVNYLINLSDVDYRNDFDTGLDVSKIIDKKHFKYITTTDDLKQYQLLVDKELIDKIVAHLPQDKKEIFKEYQTNSDIEPFNVNFYINKLDELTKVSMNLNESSKNNELSKFVVNIEFKNINSTVVNIPSEALNSKMDLESYIETYSVYGKTPEIDNGANNNISGI